MDGICMHIQQFYVSLDTDCRRMILAPGRTCIEFVFGTLRLLFAVTNTVIKKMQTMRIRYTQVYIPCIQRRVAGVSVEMFFEKVLNEIYRNERE